MDRPLPPRQNAPKDGFGPRGWPDCYYTSRTLDSTARYVKFVKKLRALEEEQRRGAINTEKELKDQQYNDFFIRCDRRSLINNVARRVDLCMASYQEDLKAKRQRLIELLTAEEEMNIRKFVEQVQAGAESLWQDKKDRLAYLLAKRRKEHEEKYKDIPISKCVHVHPCIVKMRACEAQEGQLYQMKENQAKKMAEKELDKMWHEVAMKESEALAARMELDTIERLKRDHDCIKHSDYQIAMRKEQRKKEQELLKQESLKYRAMFEEYKKKEDEESRQLEAKRQELARDRKEMIKERQDTLEKQRVEDKLIDDTWDSLAGMGVADEKANEERRRQKERELDICNKRIMKIKKDKVAVVAADNAVLEQEARRQQDLIDQKRCDYIKWSKKTNEEVRAGIKEQIKENEAARARKAKEDADANEFQRQLFKQLEKLVAHKELTEAQARKLYQSQLLEQIDYNKLIKERQEVEELEQRKKCMLAADDYQLEITKILCRLFFSEEIHPFLKQMHKGLTMREKCPCSKPDYCAVPVLGTNVAAGIVKTPIPEKPKAAPNSLNMVFPWSVSGFDPKVVPGVAVKGIPGFGVAPKAVPEVAPGAVPEVVPGAVPEVVPEAVPEVAPGEAPTTKPGASPSK